jgi:hypothetical protein
VMRRFILQKDASTEKRKSLREWIGHAFKVGDVGEPDSEDLEVLYKLAEIIVKRKLEAPAVLFLQSCIPISYIGSQIMVGLDPIVGPFFPKKDFERLTRVFERRDSIDRLTNKIEELVAERDTHGK